MTSYCHFWEPDFVNFQYIFVKIEVDLSKIIFKIIPIRTIPQVFTQVQDKTSLSIKFYEEMRLCRQRINNLQ